MARNYSEAGKGSSRRPGKGYADGWDAIWGKVKCDKCGGQFKPLRKKEFNYCLPCQRKSVMAIGRSN